MDDIRRWHPTPRMHQAVAHGGLVFTAGQVAQDNGGKSVTAQTTEILQRIDNLLEEAGTAKNRVLTASIYLANIGDFDEMNRVWDAWVAPDGKPARTTIEARLTEPQFTVEISVIAAI